MGNNLLLLSIACAPWTKKKISNKYSTRDNNWIGCSKSINKYTKYNVKTKKKTKQTKRWENIYY